MSCKSCIFVPKIEIVMRHNFFFTIVSIVALLLSISAYAQDIIVTTSAQKIEAKIVEVTKSEIRYKEKDYLDGPTFVINADEISSIIYANGKVVLYGQPVAKEEPAQVQVKAEEVSTSPSNPSPKVAQTSKPVTTVVDESLADILLLSGQTIEARIVEMKTDHVTYLVDDKENTLPASQIEKVLFKSGQVKAYNVSEPLIARPKQSPTTVASAPQTSGRIYRDNKEYMHNNRYVSKKEVARILEMEDKAAYKQWKKADGLLIGGAVCTGVGGGLVIGGLLSLAGGDAIPCIALDCCALVPLGIGLGLCLGADSKYNKAIDIYNSKYDKTTMQLQWRVAPNGVGLAIAF